MDDLKNKDKKLIEIVTQLANSLKGQSIEFVDYWEADLCATGFIIKNKLVYLSTWGSQSSNDLMCYCELEWVTNSEDKPFNLYKKFDRINLETLIDEVTKFVAA